MRCTGARSDHGDASVRVPEVGPQMSARRIGSRFIACLWAAPNTALGVLAGLVMLCFGGGARFVGGVAEFHGGRAGSFFAALLGPFCDGAVVFGHVILGTSRAGLVALRVHEHVHVRQYEHWGIFFLPAYALSSVWQVIHGRDGYRNNYFERQACAVEIAQEARPKPLPDSLPNPSLRRAAFDSR